MSCDLRIGIQDLLGHGGTYIENGVEFIVDFALNHDVHVLTDLAANVDHNDTLGLGLGNTPGFNGPPIGAQIIDLLICIPLNEGVWA